MLKQLCTFLVGRFLIFLILKCPFWKVDNLLSFWRINFFWDGSNPNCQINGELLLEIWNYSNNFFEYYHLSFRKLCWVKKVREFLEQKACLVFMVDWEMLNDLPSEFDIRLGLFKCPIFDGSHCTWKLILFIA